MAAKKKKKRDRCVDGRSLSQLSFHLEFRYTTESEDWIVCNCSFRFIGKRCGVCVGLGAGKDTETDMTGAKGQRGKCGWGALV